MADQQQNNPANDDPTPMQPGVVVKPGAADSVPAQAPAAPIPEQRTIVDDTGISWTASEFIAHEKGGNWYATLAGVAVLAAAIVGLITKDYITAGIIVFCALLFGIYGARQPRQIPYRVGEEGVTVGQKHHLYEEFRSFSIAQEGAFPSIVFMPLKRFAPATTIYYDPTDEEQIINRLLDRLPFEEHKSDLLDQFLHRIRF